jgi:hypothetical protein
MQYRRLGNSGLKVSALSLGGWTTFGDSLTDPRLARDIIVKAYDSGINFFDIADIYASSAFQIVEVTYDPQVIDAERIRAPLEQAGYLEPLPVPTETDRPVYQSDDPNVYFRHSAAYAQAGQTVSFAQRVSYAGRPLWPCPGMGPLQRMDEGE